MTKEQCLEAYRDFLADIPRFSAALDTVHDGNGKIRVNTI